MRAHCSCRSPHTLCNYAFTSSKRQCSQMVFSLPRASPRVALSLHQAIQRTPWGGWKQRGVENRTNDTSPKKGFWTPPPSHSTFSTLSGVSDLFLLYKNPRQSRTEALLEGSKNFRESAFSGTFSSPHTFCSPPYHGPSNPLHNPSPKPAIRCSLKSCGKIATNFGQCRGSCTIAQSLQLTAPERAIEVAIAITIAKSLIARSVVTLSGAPEGDRSAIGNPTEAALSAGILAIKVSVTGCDRRS